MITSDIQAKKHIKKYMDNTKNEKEFLLLKSTYRLFDFYSFVDNQTYPRPSHPKENHRSSSYFTLIAILLSLRTTLENEKKAVDSFMNRYKSQQDVIDADLHELECIIKVAGMPKKKAYTIQRATRYLIDNYDGNLDNMKSNDIISTRNQLLKIPGVGEKAADCILELGMDLPSIVVDVNMLRVCSRLFNFSWADSPNLSSITQLRAIKSVIEANLTKEYRLYQIVHTMLLMNGKYNCKANPKCMACCLNDLCNYFNRINILDNF